MRRPLYVGREARTALDAGPSIVVHAPGTAAGRYPLGYISRMVLHEQACCPLAVLTALLEENIPVTIVADDGLPLGACFGVAPAPIEPVAERVAAVLSAPGGSLRYENFLRARQRRAIIAVLKRLQTRAPDLRPVSARKHLSALCRGAGLNDAHQEFNLMHWYGMAVSLAQEQLLALAGSPCALAQPAYGWNICRDAAELLLWDLRGFMLIEAGRWRKAAGVDRKVHHFMLAAAFEQRAPRLRKLLAAFWYAFVAWLDGEEPWRRLAAI